MRTDIERLVVACGTAALVVCSVDAAEQDAPSQRPAFRSGVELVTVDVGVVDKQGQPLRGLAPADFSVSVAGQPRRVVTAEYIDVAAARVQAASRPGGVAISTNEGGGTGRLFVFVVDQSTLEPGSARRVAGAATRFLSQLTFSDRSAAVLLPTGPNVEFTWAHDKVRDALMRATGFGRPVTSWEYGSLTEARDLTNRNQIALRSVVDRECGRSAILAEGGNVPIAGTGAGGGGGEGAPPTGGGAGGGSGGASSPPPGGGGGGTTAAPSRGSAAPSGAVGMSMNPCLRDLQMRAESTWRNARMTTLGSVAAVRDLIASLARVNGDKTVILISGGWPLDDREETSLMAQVADGAVSARVTLYSLYVASSTFNADRRLVTSTPIGDQYIQQGPLETVAAMSGGASFRAEVGAEGAFDRLSRELAGYYRIAVERNPGDGDGKPQHMKVQVSRNGATVRARDIFDVRTYEDRDWAARMASALVSPVPATSVGLRLTSYLAANHETPGQLKLLLVGEASRLQPGTATLQLVVNDLQGRKMFAGEQPLGDVTADALPFSTNLGLPPGSYIVRLAVMDGTGRVGSVDHRVDVRPTQMGAISVAGPLLVRVPAARDADPRMALDSVRQDERLALEVDLEADADRLTTTDVEFQIAASDDGPALLNAPASISKGARPGSALAQGVADVRLLPPGSYVLRAKLTSGGAPLGEVRRAFAVEAIAPPRVEGASTAASVTPAVPSLTSRAPAGAVQAFSINQVLAPPVLASYVERVRSRPEATAGVSRELLQRAASGNVQDLDVPDGGAAEGAVPLFLRGLNLLARHDLESAANAFRAAMRASPDFYPAMVYLGACYAAGGKDKEAANVWQTALIREADTAAVHVWMIDALLRQGRADVALDALQDARGRWPADNALKSRFVVASLLARHYVEGLDALDDLVAEKADEEGALVFGLLVLYEGLLNHHPVESVALDRARLIRLADAYRARGGAAQALVDTWVAAARK